MEALEGIWGWLHVLLAGSLLAFGLYCCYIKSVHLRYDYIPGPPRPSFFLGHIPVFWKMKQNNGFIYDLFLQWAEEYGPVVRINAYHKITVLILSPQGIKEFLMSPDCPKDELLSRRLFHMFGVRFLGNGLISDVDPDHWYKQRRIIDPAFNRNYLLGLMGPFNDKAEDMMKILEEAADGETKVNLSSLFKRVTLDIIGKAGFGVELNALNDDQTPFPQAASNVMRGLHENRSATFEYMPWNRKLVREIQESVKLLRRTAQKCIDQRQKAMKNEEDFPKDILTQILKNAAAEGNCDYENMVDNFVSFFVAGHETTANQLSFTMMELLRHPEIMTKLQNEVDEAIGVKRDVAYEDLGKLKYLSQVLKESLRLYPPAPGTIRRSHKETIIDGIVIPNDTTLLFNMYAMGRLERFFPNALDFDPDRFGDDKPRPSLTFIPFSLGPRSCIGQSFSQMEAKVVMAKLVQRFEFQLVPPQTFKILETATLKPLDDVICTVKLRKQSESGN